MKTTVIVALVSVAALIGLPALWALYGIYGMVDEWGTWANLRQKIKGAAIAKGAFKYPAYKLGFTDAYLDANTDFIEAQEEDVPWN